MRRRHFITLFGATGLGILLRGSTAGAQSGKTYVIGILETIPAQANKANLAGLRRGLSEHGYIEGQNLIVAYRSAEGRAERFPALAAELVKMPVDLIVTRGTPATNAAKAATETLPIVMAAIGEPFDAGIVRSLAHPGGNITGLSSFWTELAGKRVELLRETLPSITRIGFLMNMGNPIAAPAWEATRSAANTLGLTAELLDVRIAQDIVRTFDGIPALKLDALAIGIDGLVQAEAKAIVDLAQKHRLPAAYPSREFVDLGGLMSYGPSYPDLYYRAAGLIDKILKGAKPGDLPVEQPTKLELVVNLRTARALSVLIPQSVLIRAEEVTE